MLIFIHEMIFSVLKWKQKWFTSYGQKIHQIYIRLYYRNLEFKFFSKYKNRISKNFIRQIFEMSNFSYLSELNLQSLEQKWITRDLIFVHKNPKITVSLPFLTSLSWTDPVNTPTTPFISLCPSAMVISQNS